MFKLLGTTATLADNELDLSMAVCRVVKNLEPGAQLPGCSPLHTSDFSTSWVDFSVSPMEKPTASSLQGCLENEM